MTETLNNFIASPVSRPANGADHDAAAYHIVSTLVLQSTAQFEASRLALLRHLVAAVARQRAGSAATAPPYDDAAHAALRPYLVLFAVVNLMHTDVLKTVTEPATAAADLSPVVPRMELMRNRVPHVLARCQQVRVWPGAPWGGARAGARGDGAIGRRARSAVGGRWHRWCSSWKRTFCPWKLRTNFTT